MEPCSLQQPQLFHQQTAPQFLPSPILQLGRSDLPRDKNSASRANPSDCRRYPSRQPAREPPLRAETASHKRVQSGDGGSLEQTRLKWFGAFLERASRHEAIVLAHGPWLAKRIGGIRHGAARLCRDQERLPQLAHNAHIRNLGCPELKTEKGNSYALRDSYVTYNLVQLQSSRRDLPPSHRAPQCPKKQRKF